MLLNETGNVVRIQLEAIQNHEAIRSTILGPVQIGDPQSLKSTYNNRYFFKVTSQQFIAFAMLFFVLISLYLWNRQRSQYMFAWFALTTFFWSVHTFVKVIPSPYYLNFEAWSIALNAGLLWFVGFGFLFVRSLSNDCTERPGRYVLAACLVMQIIYLWVFFRHTEYYAFFGPNILIPFIMFIGLLSVVEAVRNSWTHGRYWLISVAAIVVLVMGLHDTLVVLDILDGDFLLQFSAPVLLTFFMADLLSRFMETLSQQEQIYQSLGGPASKEVFHEDVDWNQMLDLDRQSVARREQERFRADLHDGISGNLGVGYFSAGTRALGG